MFEHGCEERMEDVSGTIVSGWNKWKDRMRWGRWCKERSLSRKVRSVPLDTTESEMSSPIYSQAF